MKTNFKVFIHERSLHEVAASVNFASNEIYDEYNHATRSPAQGIRLSIAIAVFKAYYTHLFAGTCQFSFNLWAL